MDNGDGAALPDRGDWRIPYDHVGDLFHEGEKPSVTMGRMRAHLPIAFPTLHASMRFMRESHDIAIFIHRFGDVDLTDGAAAQRLRTASTPSWSGSSATSGGPTTACARCR
ncbi:hypothetical protein KZ813_00250 [Sphingomonas sp. RHCKR7]|uniref:hypothetical protein n=1 Tax=Sphingomonas folli TaxID=2862497 RepID=UPI001CA4CF8E|nr:hypothetical protein [Sphingomonas folli]MBW6525266.1 hypothetical protein [Sphingomonas folli]